MKLRAYSVIDKVLFLQSKRTNIKNSTLKYNVISLTGIKDKINILFQSYQKFYTVAKKLEGKVLFKMRFHR